MKRVMKLTLLLVVSLLALFVTGCVHMEYNFELNKDNTGKLEVLGAVNVDLFEGSEGTTNFNTDDDFKDTLSMVEGIEVNSESVKYEVNDMTYEGEKVFATFDNTKEFFTILALQEDTQGMTYKELDNGNTRIEIEYNNSNSESEPNFEQTEIDFGDVEMLQMIKSMGGKIVYTIKTDYNVVSHNATKVEGNVYTWDLLDKDTAKETNSLFLEFNTNTDSVETVPNNTKIKSFVDVPKTHWAYNDIMTLVNTGIISGVKPAVNGVGEYTPNDTVSLGQFLAISTRLVLSDKITENVDGYHWAAPNYLVALDYRLIEEKDFSGNSEELDKGISREDMAQILVKVAEANNEYLKTTEGIENIIKDYKDISRDRVEAVKMAYSNGLLVGDSNGNFNPKSTLTRAEVAAVFCRVMNYTKRPVLEIPRANPIILPVDPIK